MSFPTVKIRKVKRDSIVFSPNTGRRLEAGKVYTVPYAPYWRRMVRSGAVELLQEIPSGKSQLPVDESLPDKELLQELPPYKSKTGAGRKGKEG